MIDFSFVLKNQGHIINHICFVYLSINSQKYTKGITMQIFVIFKYKQKIRLVDDL